MHSMVLVKCRPFSVEEKYSRDDFIKAASSEIEMFSGHYDYYSTDDSYLEYSILSVDGDVQYCRARDFKKFLNGLPDVVIATYYIEWDLMAKYGVSWDTVINREIEEAKQEDTDSDPVFLVCVDIHV